MCIMDLSYVYLMIHMLSWAYVHDTIISHDVSYDNIFIICVTHDTSMIMY